MNVGIVCYASVGGSGILATELAKSLADRGHEVHLLSADPPFRLGDYQPGLCFHRVNTPAYPLFREPQYLISLATRIVQVAREFNLDVVHAHYAVPHATAAYLAKQIMMASPDVHRVPRIITTLHGTDITLVGSDRSYSETVAFSIAQSDGVTAVSESLKADTYRTLAVDRDITVIPNFLDCKVHRRVFNPALRAQVLPAGLREAGDARLELPSRSSAPARWWRCLRGSSRRCRRGCCSSAMAPISATRSTPRAGSACISRVEALGEQDQVLPLLSIADLFLLPSEQESFGLAALEAMACEVPVIASRVGGLHEVVEDGVTGFLHEPDDLDGMAESGIRLLQDPEMHRSFAAEGRAAVTGRFCADLVVPMYEEFYEQLVGAAG